jgi:hypothetical protein
MSESSSDRSSERRQRVYVSLATGECYKAREWVGRRGMALSTLPHVCGPCGGRGRRRKQGCFGSRDAGECGVCHGVGRLPQGHWYLDPEEREAIFRAHRMLGLHLL